MKFKTVVLLAVALGCGLVAMLGVQQALSGPKAAQEEYAQVLFASTEITSGTMIDESNVAFKKWPKDKVPEGAVTKLEQYDQRSLRGYAVPGEMIMLAKLSEKGVWGASADIPEGMRVVTVPVDLTKSHSGLIQPGDRVDVMVTYKSRSGSGLESKTRTFLEAIQVFATDSHRSSENVREGEDIKAKNISLLVTPEQGNLVMLASSKGQIHLALRHKTDHGVSNTPVATDDMFDDAESLANVDDISAGPTPANLQPVADNSDRIRKLLQEELDRRNLTERVVRSGETEDVSAETAKDIWTIRIYSGNQVRIQEIELPAAVEQPAPAAAI